MQHLIRMALLILATCLGRCRAILSGSSGSVFTWYAPLVVGCDVYRVLSTFIRFGLPQCFSMLFAPFTFLACAVFPLVFPLVFPNFRVVLIAFPLAFPPAFLDFRVFAAFSVAFLDFRTLMIFTLTLTNFGVILIPIPLRIVRMLTKYRVFIVCLSHLDIYVPFVITSLRAFHNETISPCSRLWRIRYLLHLIAS